MGRLSTLVYAPVLLTLLAACSPHRAHVVEARAKASPAAAKTRNRYVVMAELESKLDDAKQRLTTEFLIPFRRETIGATPTLWDPSDYDSFKRRHIETHLVVMLDLFQQRMAFGTNSQLIQDYGHANFILREFRAQDARDAGKL